MMKSKQKILCWMILLVIAILVSLTWGAVKYDWWHYSEFSVIQRQDFIYIRVPRVFSACLVGMALAISGVLLRFYTHNPLADPGLIGVTGGGQLGFLIVTLLFPKSTDLFRFFGAWIGAGCILLILFYWMMRKSAIQLILVGIAISALCMGSVGMLAGLFQKNELLNDLNVGGLQGTTWVQVGLLLLACIIGLFLMIIYAQDIQMVIIHGSYAQNLGVNVSRLNGIVGFILVCFIGSATALVGNLAFFGLLVAIISTNGTSKSFSHAWKQSIFVGSTLMLWADFISRIWNAPQETSLVSVVTILCVPIFFLFIRREVRP